IASFADGSLIVVRLAFQESLIHRLYRPIVHARVRLQFTLDEDRRPVDCDQIENTDTNNMIEKVSV
ncbi:hypothetical protein AZE42_10293, partial [Rhizopogon vesiculosus]